MTENTHLDLSLSASSLHESVRAAAFALLISTHEPVQPKAISRLTGATADDLAAMLGDLGHAGWIDRDEKGRVTGSAGLSLTTGPHRLAIDGGHFRTWCAYDAIGIAAALRADATIQTECGVCTRLIALQIEAGQPARDRDEMLWLAQGGSDLRGDFCSPTVLLCSPDHAQEWAVQQEGRGQAVGLAEAAALGGAAWAACATTADRVRELAS